MGINDSTAPAHWNFKSIGDDCTLKARIGWQALTTNEYLINGSHFLVTGTDFDAGKIVWESCWYISEWRYKQDPNIQLRENDVLITKDGTIGKVGYVSKLSLPAALNSGVFVIRPKQKNDIHAKFLYYVLSSEIFTSFLNVITAGSTITHLYQKDFVFFKFLAPDYNQQEKIAQCLTNVDELIFQLEKLIEKKRQVKRGTMQTLLNPFSENGELKDGWEDYSIPDLLLPNSQAIKIGPFGSSLKKEYLTKSGYKVYGQENVYDKDMFIGNRYIDREHYLKLKSCEILPGDFLISMMGTVGKCYIAPKHFEKGIMDSHLLRLRIEKSKLYSVLLLQLFQTPIVFDQIKKLSVGGIMEGLSSKIIKQVRLNLPKITEQQEIADILNDMDKEITSLEKKLSKAKELKQGMMQGLLTGQIGLVKP